MKAPSVRSVRCAIYTRVSTEHGLDQEFNSLDAQYEAASAYIKSQAHAGWTLIRSRYDDGGYSGGSTDRPDLQKLLDDVRARKIDVIVVYKVDRLTRSLADFAKLIELFDAHGVSFVSVTQQFNTTTSMGRLTLNVLLSFAQFEREVTSERIRDKIAASKRKGLWVGGTLPFGYEMKDGKIAIVEEEAEVVRLIFRRYLELGSVNELLRDLKERNIRTRTKKHSSGATRGGIPFGRGALYYVLSNHFYIGEVKYKNEILPGEQPAIMDRALFDAVRQQSLAQWSHRTVVRNKSEHLLTGLLFDDAGHRMMAGRISMGARREITAAVVDRYRSAGRADKGRILDELCAVTGWHRKHAVRALAIHVAISPEARRRRRPTYGAPIRDALVALWEASDRICGKRLRVMIPTLLPSLERHGRLRLDQADRALVLGVSAATIDRLLVETKIAAAGGKRRRVGFYSAVRREVPIRTFNDWHDPPPGFCEVDMVAHGGTSVAGSFIQTLTMVDVATGWTECMPLVTRESGLVVRAMERAQNLFPWLIRGADFDNDSAFMNDVVVPWCRVLVAEAFELTQLSDRRRTYLPKYSPDLDPIELPYSKFKAFLRKAAARTVARLTRAIRSFVPRLQSARMC